MAEGEEDIGYSLKTFTKKFTLPQQVRVVAGIYDMLDEISLSCEEILTLHSLKKCETVKATTYEGHTFYLPLNITSKVAIIASRGSPQISNRRTTYDDVEALADDFPPLVASMERHTILDIEEGDIIKPIQTWISNPNQGSLQCSILNKPLSNDVFLPLSYKAKFKTLETTYYNALFLKEVVTNYPLPVQVRFLENRVFIQKHDLNSGKPISMESLGVITLLYQSDISLVVATTMDSDTGHVQSLITLPQNLDITITPYKGSSKRHKRKSKLLELDFCDKNFVYGSTVIEEKPLNDAEVQGYEEILPRLFPRKKSGAPSRFHLRRRRFLQKTESNHHDDDSNKDCRQGNSDFVDTSSHDNGYRGNSSHGEGTQCHGNTEDELDYARLDFHDKSKVVNGVARGNNLTEQSTRTSGPNTQGYIDMNDTINIAQELAKYQASVKYDRRDKDSKPYNVKTKKKSVTLIVSDDKSCDERLLDYKGGLDNELNNNDRDHLDESSGKAMYVNVSDFLLSQEQEKKDNSHDENSNEAQEIRNHQYDHFPRPLTSSKGAFAARDDGVDNGGGVDDSNDDADDDNGGDNDNDDGVGGSNDDNNHEDLHRSTVGVSCGKQKDIDSNANASSIFYDNNTYGQQLPQGSNTITYRGNNDIEDNGNSIPACKEDYDNCLPGNNVHQEVSHQNQEIPTQITALTSNIKLQRSVSEGNGNQDNDFLESSYQNLETLSQTNPQPAHKLEALKRLKQQRLSMTIDQDQNESTEEKRSILKERRRSDLEGYKIPSRPLSKSEQHSPRTYMRSRTLTDLFQHKAKMNKERKMRETDLFRRKKERER